MFSQLLSFFSQPANLLLLGVMFISGVLLFRGQPAAHALSLSCESLPEHLNARKSKVLTLHQKDDLEIQIRNADEQKDETKPLIRGFANTQHFVIEAGELTGEAYKGLLLRIEKIAKKTNPLILLDQDARMAKHLAKKLAKDGWDVKFLQGGLNAWLAKNLPCINIYQEVKTLLGAKNNSKNVIVPANKKQKASS